MNNLLARLNSELASLLATARQSVVQVRNGRGGGAGAVLHPEGLIVTNAHVVGRRAPRVTLWDGRTLPGRLLAVDEAADLAAVSVDVADTPVLPLADGRDIRPGEWVTALGHPWGVVGAATAGMIIDVGRPVEQLPYAGPLIQVGLHLRPGHSGGPMVNSRGEVVGINTMIAGPEVGLAIPVQTVKRFLRGAFGSGGDRPASTAGRHLVAARRPT